MFCRMCVYRESDETVFKSRIKREKFLSFRLSRGGMKSSSPWMGIKQRIQLYSILLKIHKYTAKFNQLYCLTEFSISFERKCKWDVNLLLPLFHDALNKYLHWIESTTKEAAIEQLRSCAQPPATPLFQFMSARSSINAF